MAQHQTLQRTAISPEVYENGVPPGPHNRDVAAETTSSGEVPVEEPLWRLPRSRRWFARTAHHLGGIGLLARDLLRAARGRWETGEILRQMDALGVQSLSITSLTALFTGMVLALQTAYALSEFGGKLFVGRVVVLSPCRELGPTLTALMVAARVGAGITAELGTMAVTDQVDARRALGSSPVRKLVLPRVVAVTAMLPVLTLLADFLGTLGGLFIAVFELKVGASYYLTTCLQALKYNDLMHGLCKTPFFGFEIALIGCYNGLNAHGGADGVGRATTISVVVSSIVVLASDFFLTKLFMALPLGIS
jgi:phospholipid/cholesterol/gamma-HCH transport system permease protein